MKIRTMILLVLAGLGSLALVSCNTVAGMGQDMQRAGEGIENTGEGRQW